MSARSALLRALAIAVALLVAAIALVPILYVVLGGFRTTGQIAAQPVAPPSPWRFGNYAGILTSGGFWTYVSNTTVIAVASTAIVVTLGMLAAYPLARMEFRGRDVLYTLFVLGLLFPLGADILPLYLMLRQLNLLDTGLGVVLPQAAFGLPVTIVILRPFLRAIPGELEDAATIDGASRFTFFWRILVPLARPALATVAILAFIGSWNAYFLPLLVISDRAQYTIPLGVSTFQSQYTQDTARILAFTALSMLPALAFFVLAERRIVGSVSGALRG